MLNVRCFPIGELQANCYFVTDDDSDVSLLVDTGASSSELEKAIEAFGPEKLEYLLLTHGHFDHIGNAAAIKRKYPNVKIVIGEKESDFTTKDTLNLSLYFDGTLEHFTADILVKDNDELQFGSNRIKIISTPGHTIGGVCYLIGNNLFTGDTIMSCTTGRTDFPTGNIRDMMISVAKIAEIDGNPDIYCGHGESTTLNYEREHNIFMRKSGYDDLY